MTNGFHRGVVYFRVIDMNILLIEDDLMIGQSISRALADVGIASDWITDGIDGEAAVRRNVYELLLLDLGLPRKSGFSILESMRQNESNLPTLIITARDDVEDCVAGLNLGADDYLVKPFGISEMLARIRAILRRRSDGDELNTLSSGEIFLDLDRQRATYRDKTIRLPPREFALLHILVSRSGTVLSRTQIEKQLYEWRKDVSGNAIEVLIHYIRRKFDHNIIRNVRGIGWMVVKH